MSPMRVQPYVKLSVAKLFDKLTAAFPACRADNITSVMMKVGVSLGQSGEDVAGKARAIDTAVALHATRQRHNCRGSYMVARMEADTHGNQLLPMTQQAGTLQGQLNALSNDPFVTFGIRGRCWQCQTSTTPTTL